MIGFYKWLIIRIIWVLDAIVIRVVVLLALFHKWSFLLHTKLDLPLFSLLDQFNGDWVHIFHLELMFVIIIRWLRSIWVHKNTGVLAWCNLNLILIGVIEIKILFQALEWVSLHSLIELLSLRWHIRFECRFKIYLAHAFQATVIIYRSSMIKLRTPLLWLFIHQFDFVGESVELSLETKVKSHELLSCLELWIVLSIFYFFYFFFHFQRWVFLCG